MSKGVSTSGLHPGFVIAPFCNPGKRMRTIMQLQDATFAEIEGMFREAVGPEGEEGLPPSTTAEEHRREVESIIRELQGDEHRKTIAARRLVVGGRIDLEGTFRNLCKELPMSFVFLFYTPESGGWMGGSPELLLQSHDGELATYALAGTRPAGTPGEWDRKNRIEQEIVADYISGVFRGYGLTPVVSEPRTHGAGSVEHILSEIRAKGGELEGISPQAAHTEPGWPKCGGEGERGERGERGARGARGERGERGERLQDFLDEFSPTPALCGMPKGESMERICRLEGFDREYYGGFCGPYVSPGEFTFYVILRSFAVSRGGITIFAGGGITVHSDAGEEWRETERKLSSVQRYIVLGN